MPAHIEARGLKETAAALRKLDKGLPKEMAKALKEAVQPVADASKAKISRYRGAKLNTIRPRATPTVAYVRQGAGKKTGTRPDFGALQWRRMSEALDENQEQVVSDVRDAIERFSHSTGL